jgi:release factor glutamine methyltransferase
MKLRVWLEEARAKLKLSGIGSWHQDANSIARHYLKLSSSDLILGDLELNSGDLAKLNYTLKRRMKLEPLAYIFNLVNFYGRDFYVDKRVLIPRPETEGLVDFILSLGLHEPIIIDVGTGSGAIGLSLARLVPSAKLNLLDISEDALDVAKLNSKKLESEIKARKSELKFSRSDLLENYSGEPADIIVANLPYVDKRWDWLDLKSLNFEPDIALFAEDAGLSLIKELLIEAREKLKPGGYLVLELDPSQKEEIIKFNKKTDLVHILTDPKFGAFILVFAKR